MMLTVGQKLWLVPTRGHGLPREVEVTKVGRKWASIGEEWRNERINIETLAVDGGQYSPRGYCYVSREAYEQKLRLSEEWTDLCRRMAHHLPPKGATLENIKAIRATWGI